MKTLMRIKHHTALAAVPATLLAAALAVSCARTVEMEPESATPVLEEPRMAVPDSVIFSAVLEPGSRTQIGEGSVVLWNADDKVRVFNADTPEGVEFHLTGGEGTTTGTFRGPAIEGDGPFYAVYPADAAGTLSGSAVPVTLPSSQAYAAGSFGPGANLAAGRSDALDGLHFHNLTGTLALTLAGDKSITAIRVCTYSAEPLFGTAVIDGWDIGAPVLTMDAEQTGEPFRELLLDGGAGVSLSPEGTSFHLTVPAGTLAGGYRIEVYDTDGLAMVKYAKADEGNRVGKGDLVQMPAFAYGPQYKAAYLRSDGIGAFSNAAASGDLAVLCSYDESRSQFSFLNSAGSRYLRIQDWEDGYALAFSMPAALAQGKTAAVTVTSLGLPSVASGQVGNMRVVKMSEERIWMLDPSTGHGYILMKAED